MLKREVHFMMQIDNFLGFTRLTSIQMRNYLLECAISAFVGASSLSLRKIVFRKADLFPISVDKVLASPYVINSNIDLELQRKQTQEARRLLSSHVLTTKENILRIEEVYHQKDHGSLIFTKFKKDL